MTIRLDMVDLFYKGYINAKEYYAKVKRKKVDFGPEAINTLYRLEINEIGHVIFKNPNECDL